MPIDPRLVKWDEPAPKESPKAEAPKIDPRMVKWEDEAPKATDLQSYGMSRVQSYDPTDSIAGAVRGAGSIGATLLAPLDWLARKAGVENSIIGRDDRRSQMDAGLQTLGADPQSTQFQANKLLGEVAGTAGAGSIVANGLRAIPGAARALPNLISAIESGGMTAGGAKGGYGMATRVAGSAVNGGVTAGLVNPDDAKAGMLVGGATPPVIAAAGKTGAVIGEALRAKPINPTVQQTAKDAIEAGYVIPPNMVAPNLKSQVFESISGKQATQQIASTRNTEVTEKIVRDALGIPQGTPLSQSTLENLRKTAGKAYANVSALSEQAAADLEALKIARNESQSWFKAYNRSASPIDLAKAKQFRAEADALEHALENHAKLANRPELIPALRNARKEIAKTYTVGRALNDAAGTVDARILGRMYEKGVPLSDGLEVAGKFASAFPTVAKSPQQIGSPAAHNLKAFGSLLTGAGGYAAMGPAGAAAAAVPFLAGPAARSIMFSKPVQRSLVATPSAGGLLSDALDEALPLIYRSNGLLATSGQ